MAAWPFTAWLLPIQTSKTSWTAIGWKVCTTIKKNLPILRRKRSQCTQITKACNCSWLSQKPADCRRLQLSVTPPWQWSFLQVSINWTHACLHFVDEVSQVTWDKNVLLVRPGFDAVLQLPRYFLYLFFLCLFGHHRLQYILLGLPSQRRWRRSHKNKGSLATGRLLCSLAAGTVGVKQHAHWKLSLH